MRYIYFSFLLAFILSCSKVETRPLDCSRNHDIYYSVSEEAKAKIPYTGTDTLHFLYTDSTIAADTITYIGQGKIYDTLRLEGSIPAPGCYYNNFAETYSILYKADKPGYDLKFKAVADKGDGDFYITLEKEELSDLFWTINWTGYGGYYSELKFNNMFYYQVNLFSHRGKSKTFNLYFTVQQGIIRMELFNNKVWQLID